MTHESALVHSAVPSSSGPQAAPLVQEQGESNRSELPARPTPLPWRQRFADIEGQRFPQTTIETEDGEAVVQVFWTKGQQWQETTARIVRCVNSHDELLAALKRLSFAAQTTGGTAGPDAELMAAIAQAEQALIKVAA